MTSLTVLFQFTAYMDMIWDELISELFRYLQMETLSAPEDTTVLFNEVMNSFNTHCTDVYSFGTRWDQYII